MERQKYITGLIILNVSIFLTVKTGYAQVSTVDQIYKAYATGNMTAWVQAMNAFEKNLNNISVEKRLELVSYYYGYTGWLISEGQNIKATEYISRAEVLLDEISQQCSDNATVMAYRAAFIGFEIAISNFKAIYIGRKSTRYIDQALEIDPCNIQALIEKGNALYYCPSTFGGDKKKAIYYYKRAIICMEKKQLTTNNWLYLNTMTSLGMAYEATYQIQNAKLCYEKILSIEPDYMWVGDELYPDMLKRQNL
jgi:tetratricopeptide (TPR) repeat protein